MQTFLLVVQTDARFDSTTWSHSGDPDIKNRISFISATKQTSTGDEKGRFIRNPPVLHQNLKLRSRSALSPRLERSRTEVCQNAIDSTPRGVKSTSSKQSLNAAEDEITGLYCYRKYLPYWKRFLVPLNESCRTVKLLPRLWKKLPNSSTRPEKHRLTPPSRRRAVQVRSEAVDIIDRGTAKRGTQKKLSTKRRESAMERREPQSLRASGGFIYG